MNRAILKPKEDRRLLRGHLWAFRSEFKSIPKAEDGDIVDIQTAEGKFAGRGFYQAEGGIAIRILDRHQPDIDGGFFRKRVDDAKALRDRLFPGTTTYRWIHGESDGLPGLVADRYGAIVSVRTSCAFYHKHAKSLLRAFVGQYEDVEGARFEFGNEIITHGDVPDEFEVNVDGVLLGCPMSKGQKTGLFLDQRINARILDQLAPGARVFDGFCYVGQWGLRAAKAGASEVVGIDSSISAIEQAKANVERNGVAGICRFETGDVSEWLQKGDTYDVVCVDPPAFAKAKAYVTKSMARYQGLNRDAMKAVNPNGGYLITSTCSQPVTPDLFMEMIKRAARSAQRSVRVLAMNGAPADHPVLLAMPETAYLTNVVLRVD